MKSNTAQFAALVLSTLLASASYAQFDPMTEAVETMMEAQMQNEGLMVMGLGAENAHFSYTSFVDIESRNFGFDLDPGQSYMGQTLSISTSAVYNGGTYDWITNTAWGSNNWTVTGHADWVHDSDTFDASTSATIGAVKYAIDGRVTLDGPRSQGTYTFTGGGSTYGPYDGSDMFLDGRWVHTINVPRNPLVPNGIVIASNGNNPWPHGGIGVFESDITVVPEPASLAVLGYGLATFLAFKRRL